MQNSQGDALRGQGRPKLKKMLITGAGAILLSRLSMVLFHPGYENWYHVSGGAGGWRPNCDNMSGNSPDCRKTIGTGAVFPCYVGTSENDTSHPTNQPNCDGTLLSSGVIHRSNGTDDQLTGP